jgi:Glycosyl transferase family 90
MSSVGVSLAWSGVIQLLSKCGVGFLSIVSLVLGATLFTVEPSHVSLKAHIETLSGTARIRLMVAALFVMSAVAMITFSTHTIHSRPLHIFSTHPISTLIQDARSQFSDIYSRQSRTLPDAVVEYRRRNGVPPPPKFDLWFAFAMANNVRLIDEFDTIRDLIRPFWGMTPEKIRKRVRDAYGAEGSDLLAILIRDGTVANRTQDTWQSVAITEILRRFVHHLPDMDLVFNIHDEPSIVLQNDMLNYLVSEGQVNQAVSLRHNPPRNVFSQRPDDLVDDMPEHYGTQALRISRQNVWQQVIASCPLNSPVRNPRGGKDLRESYAREPLGFIYNTTAFSEVCNQPSLPFHHGFFDRPNSMTYSPVLFPLFSVSKVSTFNDLLFPSPWYYDQKTHLDSSRDMEWDEKINQIHWRGSTTTGYPANGGWRRHHRQRFIKAMDHMDEPVRILREVEGSWIEDRMSPVAAQALFDVKFSSVSDSSTPEDQAQQNEEFDIAPMEDQQDLWKWKHLLDIDGHGMSGRFYPMMKSNSLVYKSAMFREWHDEWLRPWVHYIPLGLDGDDWFETVRYFALEKAGQTEALEIARASRDWSRSVLRMEDMETWVFRLLLEYRPFGNTSNMLGMRELLMTTGSRWDFRCDCQLESGRSDQIV